jgi:hypothetical protein
VVDVTAERKLVTGTIATAPMTPGGLGDEPGEAETPGEADAAGAELDDSSDAIDSDDAPSPPSPVHADPTPKPIAVTAKATASSAGKTTDSRRFTRRAARHAWSKGVARAGQMCRDRG